MDTVKQKMKQKVMKVMEQTTELVVWGLASLRGQTKTPDDEAWEVVGLDDATGMKETTAQPGVSGEVQRLLEEAKRLRKEAWEESMLGKISEEEKDAYFATKVCSRDHATSLLRIMASPDLLE